MNKGFDSSDDTSLAIETDSSHALTNNQSAKKQGIATAKISAQLQYDRASKQKAFIDICIHSFIQRTPEGSGSKSK